MKLTCWGRRAFPVAGFLFAVAGACAIAPGAGNAPKRAPDKVLADIKAADGAIPNYDMNARLDPRYRHQMVKEVVPHLKEMAALYAELEAASPAIAAKYQVSYCFVLAELAVDGDADALKTLEDASQSAKPATALFGKVGLLAEHWWEATDDAEQAAVAADFEKLAKANPREDMLVHSALFLARVRATSDANANALRDVVDKDLHGQAAIVYQHQLVKFGRPFKVTVPIVGGKPLSIASWKGKVVLIDFWATWCPPCRESLPHLAQLYHDYHAKGLEVVGISNDYSLVDLKQFLARNKDIVWPQSFSPAAANQWHTLAKQCGVDGIPTSILIDRNGILRSMRIGLPSEETIQKYLDEPAAEGPTEKSGQR